MKHILVTTDFSEPSKSAFPYAIEYAELLGKDKAKITLLSIVEELAQKSVQSKAAMAILESHGIREKLYNEAQENLESLAKEYFSTVNVENHIIRAKKAAQEEIVEYAKNNEVDLIVIATHGRTGLMQFLLGSVSEKVIRHSPCAVLVAPVTKESIEKEAAKDSGL